MGSKEKEVIIYGKSLQLDVVVPEDRVWEFAMAFGKAFMINDSHMGQYPKAINGYYYHPDGYHVQITIHVSEEQKFYDFLKNFCNTQKLSVREEDLRPGQ